MREPEMTPAADGRPRRRRAALIVLGAVWLGSLLGVALPAWRQAHRQQAEVAAIAGQLAELDRWTVAGLWLEQSLDERAAAIEPAWSALFPAERRREEMFLDLARVADRSGVTAFELREIKPDELAAGAPGLTGDEPEADLSAYRVRASFEGDYEQVAGFLGGLKGIERAVSVHNLEIRPVREAVSVELELDVYVDKPERS